jgi:CubicO group peptidase (beta-lactamase class C family)
MTTSFVSRSAILRRPGIFVCTLIAVALPWSAAAQDVDVTGHWSGEIEIPGNAIAFNLDLSVSDGEFMGDISIPVQAAQDLPLAALSLDGLTLTFMMPGVPGDPTFVGEVSEDGDTVAGTFSQGGGSFPFSMTSGVDVVAATAEAMEGFGEWISENMKEWVVPGMSVGIVRDGQVVFAEGFGMRDVEKGLPATSGTLFAIGSSSKAFTSMGVGLLVDEGKVSFDEPVSTYLPGFKLWDPVATLQLTPRDMLSHRSGLPRHDAAWYNNFDLTPDSLFKVLRYFEPNRELRQTWQYNNMMFATSGYLIEVMSGESWQDFTKERILDPLGMSHTNFSVEESQRSDDFALPYGEEEGTAELLPFRNIDNVAPAGSINSSVDDMVRWVEFQLAGGKWGEEQIVAEGTVDQMHTPQMVLGGKPTDPMLGPQSYGLAWFIDTYRGHYRVEHGGNIDGFSALVTLFPQDAMGIVVLSNRNGSPMPEFAVRQIADRILGLEPRGWSEEALKRVAAAKENEDEGDQQDDGEMRIEGTSPSFDLGDYAGEYEHPGYGLAEITQDASGLLQLHFHGMSAPLVHWHFDVFKTGENAEDAALEGNKVQFMMDMDGRIEGLRVALEPSVAPIVFERAADAILEDTDYLEGLTGTFELAAGIRLEVTLSGNVLTATVSGQPPYRLEPLQDDTFALEGLKGFKAHFSVVDGVATEVTLLQPNGSFTAKRVEGGA